MAHIVEIHHSQDYARLCGMATFVDVLLHHEETARDYVVSFYKRCGTVALEVALNHPRVSSIIDSETGDCVYTLSSDVLPIKDLADPLDEPDVYRAIALTSKPHGNVLDFYRLGQNPGEYFARDGAASGHHAQYVPIQQDQSPNHETLRWPDGHIKRLERARLGPMTTGFACFTEGTQIQTTKGLQAVESLQAGDMVHTQDEGPLPLRWIGKRRVRGQGEFAPVRFSEAFLGTTKPLLFSPQHCLLVTGWPARECFGEPEVLVPAAGFLQFDGVARMSVPWVTYVHLLFDSHQIVFAEDVPSETLRPLDLERDTWDKASATEILSIFPELRRQGRQWPLARKTVTAAEARTLGAF
ncbi:MAG: Hint domain-containing protein [Paracoccaceae bacterium]